MAVNDATTAPASTTAPADALAPDFRLQFLVETGQAYPAGLYQWTSVLNVIGGRTPQSSMYISRHNGDMIGQPVGLFSAPLPVVKARQIVANLDAAAAKKLPPPTSGDINASTLRLKYQRNGSTFSAEFNAVNFGVISTLGPVMNDLRTLMSQLLAKPERAVSVSVDRKDDPRGGISFQWTLTNIGTAELTVADPRLMTRGGMQRAVVQVAKVPPRVPGQMEIPPTWQPLAMTPSPTGVEDNGIVLSPNQSTSVLTTLWMPPASSDYLVQGIWQDYLGPVKIDPLKYRPAIPASAEADTRPFLVRGATFSRYTRFNFIRK